MPDNAIAAGVNAPDPTQGINLYRAMLGLQQQKQSLQTGQYFQGTAQSQMLQQQQKTREIQAGAQLMSDPLGNGLVDESGNPTPDAYLKVKRAMPTTGDEHYKDMIDSAKAKVDYQDAWTRLTEDQRNVVGSRLAAVAADPKSTNSDMLGVLDSTRREYAGTGSEAGINRIADIAAGGIARIDAREGPQPEGRLSTAKRQYAQTLSRGGLSPQQISGAGGVGTPELGRNLMGQPTVASRVSGGVDLAATGPGAAPSAPAAAAAGAGAIGSTEQDVARAAAISNDVKPSREGLGLVAHIKSLTQQIRTGTYTDEITRAMASLPENQRDPGIAARQIIAKDSERLRVLLAGGAPTDAARGDVTGSLPDPSKMNNEAMDRAADYVGGYLRINLARDRIATKYQNDRGNSINPVAGVRAKDNAFTSQAEPLMFAYRALPTGPQRQAFLRSTFGENKEAMKDFVARMNALEHTHAGVFDIK